MRGIGDGRKHNKGERQKMSFRCRFLVSILLLIHLIVVPSVQAQEISKHINLDNTNGTDLYSGSRGLSKFLAACGR